MTAIALRPLRPDDITTIRTIETSPGNLENWRFLGSIPSPEAHRAALWSGVHDQRVIELDDDVVGLGMSYHHDVRSRTLWFAIVVAENLHTSGVGVRATCAFISYLFHAWDVRKIYAEVRSGNLVQFRRFADLATIEGVLRDHVIIRGEHQDVALIAVGREEWLDSRWERMARQTIGGRVPARS